MRTVTLTNNNYATMLNSLQYAYESMQADMNIQGDGDEQDRTDDLAQLINGIIAENREL